MQMRDRLNTLFDRTFNSSLANRLVVAAGVMSIIVLAVIVLILSEVFRTSTLSLLDDEMDRTLKSLLVSVNASDQGEIILDEETLPAAEVFQTAFSGRYWVVAGLDAGSGNYTDEPPIVPKSLYQGDIPWPDEQLQKLLAEPGETIRTSGPGPIGQLSLIHI